MLTCRVVHDQQHVTQCGVDREGEGMVRSATMFHNHITKNVCMAYYFPTSDVPARSVAMITLMVSNLPTVTEARLVDIPDVNPRTLIWG